jgi:D-alanine-D-alanine ligase
MMQFALRAIRSSRRLRKIPLGVLYYTDEGRECRYSSNLIQEAAARAGQVLVLRPANADGKAINQRRGWRKYHLIADDKPRRLGKAYRRRSVLRWLTAKLDEMIRLSSRADRIAVDVSEMKTETFTHLLPHRIHVALVVSFVDVKAADAIEKKMCEILDDGGYSWDLELISDRPPMRKGKRNEKLVREFRETAEQWEIPFGYESSLYPSAAGLVSASRAVLCGLGPVGFDVDTPKESIERISILQRTLLLAQFLVRQVR